MGIIQIISYSRIVLWPESAVSVSRVWWSSCRSLVAMIISFRRFQLAVNFNFHFSENSSHSFCLCLVITFWYFYQEGWTCQTLLLCISSCNSRTGYYELLLMSGTSWSWCFKCVSGSLHVSVPFGIYKYANLVVCYLATCSYVLDVIGVSLLQPYTQRVVDHLPFKPYSGCKLTPNNGPRKSDVSSYFSFFFPHNPSFTYNM